MARRLKVGIALGSGSARGWAHIGVLRYLREQGVEPDVICGTSVGALVGAMAGAGELDAFEAWVRGLQWKDVLGFMDVRLNGGLISGRRLFDNLGERFADRPIESLSRPFAAVTTDLDSGHEVWLRTGSVFDAVRASLALPGLFVPYQLGDRWLVDGGLVNPVPVSVCRALGAEVVIAVDLNVDIMARTRLRGVPQGGEEPRGDGNAENWAAAWKQQAMALKTRMFGESVGYPSLPDVVARSLHIMQVRIGRSRMAGDPPEVLISPRLANIGLIEYHRAADAIAAGERSAEAAWPAVKTLLGRA